MCYVLERRYLNMVDYKKATLDDIIEDAKENDRVSDLKSMAGKKGSKGGKISFIELKRAYYTKFYKKMIPVAKPKSPSMWERIEEL